MGAEVEAGSEVELVGKNAEAEVLVTANVELDKGATPVDVGKVVPEGRGEEGRAV